MPKTKIQILRDWRINNPDRNSELAKQFRERNPHYQRDFSRRDRARKRIEMLEAYGGRCVNCGISDAEVLDIDHINGGGRQDRKKGLWGYRLYRWLRINGYPKDNFQLLCKNCNWKKALKEIKSRKKLSKQ